MSSLGYTVEEVPMVAMEEANGARILRLFPTQHLRDLDPFVRLDEFTIRSPAGYPEHAHKGFESVTYMIEGSVRHTDGMGNDDLIDVGAVQHVCTGRGTWHAEHPGADGDNRGVQLWINLARRHKQIEPSYQHVAAAMLPRLAAGGRVVRTIIGGESPVDVRADMLMQDIRVVPGTAWICEVPLGNNGVVVPLQGEIEVANRRLTRGHALVIRGSAGGPLSIAGDGRVVVALGHPLGEPIILQGPFVM
jgi:hypothetical protein